MMKKELARYDDYFKNWNLARKAGHRIMKEHFEKLMSECLKESRRECAKDIHDYSYNEKTSYISDSFKESNLKGEITFRNEVRDLMDNIKNEACCHSKNEESERISNILSDIQEEARLLNNSNISFSYEDEYSLDSLYPDSEKKPATNWTFETSENDYSDYEYQLYFNGIADGDIYFTDRDRINPISDNYLPDNGYDEELANWYEEIRKYKEEFKPKKHDSKMKEKLEVWKGFKFVDDSEKQFYYHLVNDSSVTKFTEPCHDKQQLIDLIINSGYMNIYSKYLIKQESHNKFNPSSANTCLDIVNHGFRDSSYYDICQELTIYMWELIESGDVYIGLYTNEKTGYSDFRIMYETYVNAKGEEKSIYWKCLRKIRDYLNSQKNKVTILSLDYQTGKKEEEESLHDYLEGIANSYIGNPDSIEKLYAKCRIRAFVGYLKKHDMKNWQKMKDIILLSHQGFRQDEIACLVYGIDSKSNVRKVKYLKDKAMQYVDMFESEKMDKTNWKDLINSVEEMHEEKVIINGKSYSCYR